MHVSFDYGDHKRLRTNLPATYSKKKNTLPHLIAPHDVNHNGPEPEGHWIKVVREDKAGGYALLQAACGLRGAGDEPFVAVRATASLTQFTQCTADSRRSVCGYLPLPRLQLTWRVVTRHPGDTSQILENCDSVSL